MTFVTTFDAAPRLHNLPRMKWTYCEACDTKKTTNKYTAHWCKLYILIELLQSNARPIIVSLVLGDRMIVTCPAARLQCVHSISHFRHSVGHPGGVNKLCKAIDRWQSLCSCDFVCVYCASRVNHHVDYFSKVMQRLFIQSSTLFL